MLKKSLTANAVFSCVTASIIWVKLDWLSVHIPMHKLIFLVVVVGLYSFTAVLIAMVLQETMRRRFTPLVVFADYMWVVLTIIALLWFYSSISQLGFGIVMLTNVVVFTLARLQRTGFNQVYQK